MRPKGERIPPSKKAAGITLASFGGVTILHDLHVFEHGSFNLGALLRMDFGGGPAGVTVHDGGVSLRCDPGWTVGEFATGKIHYLFGETEPVSPRTPSSGLKADVRALAADIARDAPAGTILLIGSGDEIAAQDKNASLASDRAELVKKLLDDSFAQGATEGAPREILLGNEALAYVGAKEVGDGQPLGLARLLYGAEEASARSVQACVLQPRPHGVEAWGSAGPAPNFWGGLAVGLALSAIILTVLVISSLFRDRRRVEQEVAATSAAAARPSSARGTAKPKSGKKL